MKTREVKMLIIITVVLTSLCSPVTASLPVIPLVQDTIIGVFEPSFAANCNINNGSHTI